MDTLYAPPSERGAPRAIPTRATRPWLLPVAAAGLIAIAAGAGVLVGRHSAAPAVDATPASATAAPEAPSGPPPRSAAAQGTASPTPDGGRSTAPAKPARSTPRQAPAADTSPALDTRPARAVPVCASCGVVESVQTDTRQGEGSGVGAVAGGVVGGLLGNQVGKGNGRTAMTVLGALGGGVAGNAIEKQQRARTVYLVKVRMDDGTLRSFTRSEPWTAGQRVTVDGSALQAVADPTPAPREPVLKTTGPGLNS